MSDQGFTEIQLSGKQLVFLFMSLVIVAVVIFLFGVAVGRGVRGAVSEAPISADGGLTTTEVPDDAAVAAADSDLTYHQMLLGDDTAAATGADAASPATAPVPVAEPTAPPASAPAPPVNTDVWFLQTGAYSTRAVADNQVEKLKQLKFPAFVLEPGAGSPTKLFRVRVGPYAERSEAEQAQSRLQRQGYEPSIQR